jgi:hypothetical protein
MGTWGADDFASDGALDFLDEQVDRYLGIIEDVIADEQRFRLDEDAESMLIPSVRILTALATQLDAFLPDTLDVEEWKARYLAMYDAQIDGLHPVEGYKAERRAAIATAFDGLNQAYQAQQKRQWASG